MTQRLAVTTYLLTWGYALIANPHNPTEFAAATPYGLFILTIDHSGKPHKVLLSSKSLLAPSSAPTAAR